MENALFNLGVVIDHTAQEGELHLGVEFALIADSKSGWVHGFHLAFVSVGCVLPNKQRPELKAVLANHKAFGKVTFRRIDRSQFLDTPKHWFRQRRNTGVICYAFQVNLVLPQSKEVFKLELGIVNVRVLSEELDYKNQFFVGRNDPSRLVFNQIILGEFVLLCKWDFDLNLNLRLIFILLFLVRLLQFFLLRLLLLHWFRLVYNVQAIDKLLFILHFLLLLLLRHTHFVRWFLAFLLFNVLDHLLRS